MSDDQRRVPSAEEEALWRKRFSVFALLRVSGLVLMFIGIGIALSDWLRPGGWPVLGWILAVLGLGEAMIMPRLVQRRWKDQ